MSVQKGFEMLLPHIQSLSIAEKDRYNARENQNVGVDECYERCLLIHSYAWYNRMYDCLLILPFQKHREEAISYLPEGNAKKLLRILPDDASLSMARYWLHTMCGKPLHLQPKQKEMPPQFEKNNAVAVVAMWTMFSPHCKVANPNPNPTFAIFSGLQEACTIFCSDNHAAERNDYVHGLVYNLFFDQIVEGFETSISTEGDKVLRVLSEAFDLNALAMYKNTGDMAAVVKEVVGETWTSGRIRLFDLDDPGALTERDGKLSYTSLNNDIGRRLEQLMCENDPIDSKMKSFNNRMSSLNIL